MTEQDRGQAVAELQAEIDANGYAVVRQPVKFIHKSYSTGRDVYDFDEEDLPQVPGVYLYCAVLDQTPQGTETMTSRVLLYDPDRVKVINSREMFNDVDHARRVATKQHATVLVDNPEWGLIAVKPKQVVQA